MTATRVERWASAYAAFVVRRRAPLLIGLLGFALFAASGVLWLHFDTSFRVWQRPDSPELAAFDALTERFGSDDTILVAFREAGPGVLDNGALEVVARLTEALWKVPSVKRVDSLSNFSITKASRLEHESMALAVADRAVAAAGDENDVLVWDRARWTLRRFVGPEGLVDHLIFDPRRSRLYAAGVDRRIFVFDVATGATLFTLEMPEKVTALALDSAASRLAAGSAGLTRVFELERDASIAPAGQDPSYVDLPADEPELVTQLAFSADGSRLYTAGRAIDAWDHGARTGRFVLPSGRPTALRVTASGVYAATDAGLVLRLDPATGEGRALYALNGANAPTRAVLSMLPTPEDDGLILGTSDGSVRRIYFDGRADQIARLHDGPVLDLAASHDGRIYSASRDRNVGVHRPGQGPALSLLAAHRAAVSRVLVSADGTAFTLGDDGDLYVYGPDLSLLRRLERHAGPPPAIQEPPAGPVPATLLVKNELRFPIELSAGGVRRGLIPAAATGTISGLRTRAPLACSTDADCLLGQYCDLDQDEASCISRAPLVAYLAGTDVEVWRGEASLHPDRAVPVQIPAQSPFSVAEVLGPRVDPRSRLSALEAAFPVERARIEAALSALLGRAPPPDLFLGPGRSTQLLAALGEEGVSAELRSVLGALGSARLSALSLPVDPRRLREIGDALLREPSPAAKGAVVNAAKDTTLVVATLRIDPARNHLAQAAEVRAIVERVVQAEEATSGRRFHLAGDAVQDTTLAQYAERDLAKIFPLFLLTIALVLLLWYRRPGAVFLPIGLVLLAIGITLGIAGHFGAALDNLTAAVPQVVLACTVGDANHVYSHFLDRVRHGDSREAAVLHAIESNFGPCFWTSLTTTLGFLSLVFASILPIQNFGWMCAIGTTVAWINTFTVLPAALALLPLPRSARAADATKQGGFFAWLDRQMASLALYVSRSSAIILAITAALVSVAAYGFTKLSFETNTLEFFHEHAPFRRAAQFVEEHLTGPYGFRVWVDTKEPGGLRKVQHLASLAALEEHLAAMPEVTAVVGLADIQKAMNRAMTRDLDEDYRLPRTDREASAYHTAFSLSLRAGLDLGNRVSADEASSLIDVRLKNRSAEWVVGWGRALESWATIHTPDLAVKVTGRAWLFSYVLSEMAASFFSDVAQAVLTISITLFFVARTFRLGLIAMVVNVLPLFVTVGFASLIGVRLDLSMVVACSVAMGIVVDDTIHYVAKYQRIRGAGRDHEHAVVELAEEHSKASVATMLILISGFSMFALSDYMVTLNFGVTTAAMLFVGSLFDLFVAPAMLKLWGMKQ